MILTFVLGVVAGASLFGLVIRNNPSLGKKLGLIVDRLEEELDSIKEQSKAKKSAKKQ